MLPLAETYGHLAPFLGAIVSGVFTTGALNQLKSVGFQVLYFEYSTVLEAFGSVGLDASSEEGTPVSDFVEKLESWDGLSGGERSAVGAALMAANRDRVAEFFGELEETVTRGISVVRILPLHGQPSEFSSVREAIPFVGTYEMPVSVPQLNKYEVEVRYDNGDIVRGEFSTQAAAIGFLGSVT